jgi:RHS repeat-associated protein
MSGSTLREVDRAYAPQGTSTPGPTPNGPGYTGHVNDPETNLVYMQARYYDPATGHFLSTDPVRPVPGDAFNFNRYTYVNNNPIMGMDPTGMEDSCGVACDFMRRVSDSFSRIVNGDIFAAHGSPNRPLGQMQATTSYMNGEINQDLATAAGAAAPVADAIPGATLGACVSGEACGASDWIMGSLSALPAEGIEAEGVPFIAAAVHGNSAASTATAYLYRLTTAGGDLLKWGISKNPSGRYTQGFMEGKNMSLMTSGSRREMLNLERWIVEHDPGALNREPWAGRQAGDVP